jgi:hypothetical protein
MDGKRPHGTEMKKATSIVAATLILLGACSGPREQVSAQAQSGQPSAQQYDSLDQLLAPIALYPDSLLAQILMGAADPAKVTELDKWLKAMQSVKGTQLQDAALKAGFDPSLVALVLFPQVVAKMAGDIRWTTLLGQAFAADRSAVFASIQRLRHQAQNVGTLKTTPQQEVSTQTTSAGEQVIVIEPANPQVVYVPQYNTTTVYTQAPTTTVVVVEDNSADQAVAAGLIGFTAGIAIGAAASNPYYYGPYGWHGGGYMYNDAWDDYYDRREDAREDWQDHREDMSDNRQDRAENARDNGVTRDSVNQKRTESQNRTTSQAQGRQPTTQGQTATTQAKSTQRTGSPEARGYSDGSKGQAAQQRSGASSDAFSGYSSGKSERSASSRGQQSRSSSRGGGGGGRRR